MEELGGRAVPKLIFPLCIILAVISLFIQQNYFNISHAIIEIVHQLQLVLSVSLVILYGRKGFLLQTAFFIVRLLVSVYGLCVAKNEHASCLMEVFIAEFVCFCIHRQTILQSSDIAHYKARINQDNLTGLDNYMKFLSRISNMINEAQANTEFFVVYIDLDNFKSINDTLGHQVGNIFLCEVSHNMQCALNQNEHIARVGGDEFTVLIPAKMNAVQVFEHLSVLLRTIETPFIYGEHTYSSSASIGVARFPQDGTFTNDLIMHADEAMYRSKQAGKARISFYNAAMQKEIDARRIVENSVKDAVGNGEFYIMYQPQFHVSARQLRGIAAQVCWDSPSGTTLNPHEFLPLAEETGAILDVGKWLLQCACNDYMKVRDSYEIPPVLNVEISYKQLRTPQFAADVENVIQRTGMNAENLELSILASKELRTEKTTASLLRLHGIGVRIMLQIASAEKSTFEILPGLQVDSVKIAHTLVKVMFEQETFIKKLLAFCHKRNISVLAEDITEEKQLNFLAENKCDFVQGDLLCRAASIVAL